ncbi:MAG: hypothetical protein Alpg2KO_23900 [Alphaproteobacteria bacterium]
MTRRPVIHILCGFIGAGKTSFAKQLAHDTGAHRYTPDDMIVERFGNHLTPDEISAANGTIKAEIARDLEHRIRDRQDCILDYGLWRRDKRDELRAELAPLDADLHWYHVTCAPALMKRRALARSQSAGPGVIVIDEAHFDERLPRFQPPAPEEQMTTIRTDTLTPVAATDISPRKTKSLYPAEFSAQVEGRLKRQLGEAFGLTNFGINLTTLPPGAKSALLHAHSTQDEFVYILSGTVTRVTEQGDQAMTAGDCIGFPAGGPAHQLVNKCDQDAIVLEVGDRSAGDQVVYPQDDLKAVMGDDGHWQFTRKDGSPYE